MREKGGGLCRQEKREDFPFSEQAAELGVLYYSSTGGVRGSARDILPLFVRS